MISPYHLTQQSRDELMAVSADHRARLKARREQRAYGQCVCYEQKRECDCGMKRNAADNARNLLARAAGSNLSRRFDARPLTFWGDLS